MEETGTDEEEEESDEGEYEEEEEFGEEVVEEGGVQPIVEVSCSFLCQKSLTAKTTQKIVAGPSDKRQRS